MRLTQANDADLASSCDNNTNFEKKMAPDRIRVLFVCVENSNRSQMAESFMRIHSVDAVQSYSAGSKPSGVINPKAIRFMAELGYDLTRHQSKSLSEVADIEFDAVITMGCGDSCPWIPARIREDWKLEDPKHLDDEGYRAVRDDISARVKLLLAQLTRTSIK